MQKCPRCHSTMMLDFSQSYEGFQRMWKCICCGREQLKDHAEQAEDDRLLERVRRTSVIS